MFSDYKNNKRISADINMTPMIDIVFQLLTFFMITSTFIQTSSLNVNLPEAQTSDSVAEQENIITIFPDNSITWNDSPISKEVLPQRLTALKQQNPNASIVIQGDEEIAYGLLVEIMDHVRVAGIDQLSLATTLKK